MSINLKIEGIICHNIFIETNIINWDQYKNNILINFHNINFYEQIEDYIPNTLYVSRQRMRKILYDSIVLNNKIFIEVGYNSYQPKEQYNIKQRDIYNFIEECIEILVKKQKIIAVNTIETPLGQNVKMDLIPLTKPLKIVSPWTNINNI